MKQVCNQESFNWCYTDPGATRRSENPRPVPGCADTASHCATQCGLVGFLFHSSHLEVERSRAELHIGVEVVGPRFHEDRRATGRNLTTRCWG